MKIPNREEIERAAHKEIGGSSTIQFPSFIKGAEWMEQQLEPLITELGMDKARKTPQSVEVMTLNAKEFIYSKQYCEDSYFDFNEQVLPFMEEYALQFKLQAEEATRIAFETITEIATQRDSLKAELEQVKAENSVLIESINDLLYPKLSSNPNDASKEWHDILLKAEKVLQSTKQ